MDPQEIIDAVIARHGPIIDLNESPEIFIDILQRFRLADDLDGGTPAGAPPPPPPPPPTSAVLDIEPTTQELMRELLTLRREVAALRASLERN
jgi:hypothetical protein